MTIICKSTWIVLLSACLHVHITFSASVKVGALVAMNTSIGMSALSAMKLALEDISKNTSLLNGTQLDLIVYDTGCSAIQGVAAAMGLMKEEVVAIVGPQTSVVSHFISHMAGATQVPLISFSATDPNLSEYQYPYFLRVARSDSYQMKAIAEIIGSFGWREVVAIYIDDDFGVNGINALAGFLQQLHISIVYRAALDYSLTYNDIANILTETLQLGSRIYVIHMHPDMAKMLLRKAYELKMMASGFVWIVTETIIYSLNMENQLHGVTEGILGLQTCIPYSVQLHKLKTRLRQVMQDADNNTNVYAFWAYDSVWALALAVDGFLKQQSNFTFELPSYTFPGRNSDFSKLKIMKEGPLLLEELLEIYFRGVCGNIVLDKGTDIPDTCFEVVNIKGGQLNVVGNWINGSFASSSVNTFRSIPITWPGGGTRIPRGWVFPKNAKLIIGIPNKHGFKEFVDATATPVSGFCIDVFAAAVSKLPYSVRYEFKSFGDGHTTPSYDELVRQLANKEYDAIVGDVTITPKRSMLVDFTQPYATSGLVVVVPLRKDENRAWAFMTPFTPGMWCTTGAFFLFTGIVVWWLEHKGNSDFRGRRTKQIVTTLWFSFSTLFFSQREDVKSTLGRAVLIIWLFIVLIVNSSYIAILTATLTWQQLTPYIRNIGSLLASNVQIGFQTGSFVKEYLLQLNTADNRLVPLDSLEAYATALKKGLKAGGVGAVVDELPYVQLFLSSHCEYAIADQAITKYEWGFAFQKGSQLAVDFSRAILTISEDGTLQHIHDKWFRIKQCKSANAKAEESNKLGMGTFWGLFLITGTMSITCLLIYYTKLFWHFRRAPPDQHRQGMSQIDRRPTTKLKSFISFVEERQLQDKEPTSLQNL